MFEILQDTNRNIALDPRNNPDISLEIQLDMYLQAPLDILIIIQPKPFFILSILIPFALSFLAFSLVARVGYRAHCFAYVGEAATAGCVANAACKTKKAISIAVQ